MVATISAEQELFEAARSVPAGTARSDYLHKACADDPDLRRRIEALLGAYEESDQFLDSPVSSLRVAFDLAGQVLEPPGTVIGHYRLMEVAGEGGMGVVYRAEQTEPVQRQVALKIIKAGMDTRRTIARFDAERQALAMMDHPNIARVLDAGITKSGRPYFVMELVAGKPITQYCNDERLSVRQRLELMIPVCQAIQHAHQKGIIHRDIKPTNVLVATCDGRPMPKVIDFGVAKAVQGSKTGEGQTRFTTVGQIIGTPEYMAPEQAELGAIDIDTRSDVYSLGVLLYELLTGTTPFGKERLNNAGFDEMRRIIREEEPETVSNRLAKTVKCLVHAADHSGVDGGMGQHTATIELDWIIAKCLEKDRNQRYETAIALGDDLARFLRDEAVQACPRSAGYTLRKYVRRHRALLTMAALVGLSLVMGTIASTWQAIRASRMEAIATRQAQIALAHGKKARVEEQNALAAAATAEESRRRAEAQTAIAEEQRQQLEKQIQYNNEITNAILSSLSENKLFSATQRGRLLEIARNQLSEFEPAQRAIALHIAGKHFLSMNQYVSARSVFDEALALDPTNVAVLVSRGDLSFRKRQFLDAVSDYTAALDLRPQIPKDATLPLARRALAHCRQGHLAGAIDDFEASFKAAPTPTLNFLAAAYHNSGPLPAKRDSTLQASAAALVRKGTLNEYLMPNPWRSAADVLGSFELFEEADQYLQEALRTGESGVSIYYRRALLALWRDDRLEYRRQCQAAMNAIAREHHATVANTCCFAPGGLDDYTRLIELSRQAAERKPKDAHIRRAYGFALYRGNRHEEAVAQLKESLIAPDNPQGEANVSPYGLAMAYYQLGNTELASKHFERGEEATRTTPFINWRFRLIVKMLRAEAVMLLDTPQTR